jgi:hypothetical protein
MFYDANMASFRVRVLTASGKEPHPLDGDSEPFDRTTVARLEKPVVVSARLPAPVVRG